MLKVLIGCHQHVEPGLLRECQEFAVSFSGPAQLECMANRVTARCVCNGFGTFWSNKIFKQ